MQTGGGPSKLLVSTDLFAFSSKFQLLLTAIERGTTEGYRTCRLSGGA